MTQESSSNLAKPFCPLPLDKKFLTKLSEQLVEAVLVVELGSRYVVYANAAAEAVFGYPAAEIVGQTAERLFPERSSFDYFYQSVLPEIKHSRLWRGRWEYRRPNGSTFTAEASATLFRANARSYVTLVVGETGSWKQSQAGSQDMSQQLAEAGERREQEHMAAVGTAAAMLAHQIKNPLNGISTTVQLLERSLARGELAKEKIAAAVRDLENEIARLQALLGDFQTISLPQRLNLQSVDLARLAGEAMALAVHECKNSTIETREQWAAGLPPVAGDPERLKQALVNLINNSCEAMPNGGTLTLKGYPCDNQICLEVIDTGQGVPEGLQIFDLFTSSKPRGTGLGLVIVQQIILAHGGTVTFSSEPGKGATFRLTLRSFKESDL